MKKKCFLIQLDLDLEKLDNFLNENIFKIESFKKLENVL